MYRNYLIGLYCLCTFLWGCSHHSGVQESLHFTRVTEGAFVTDSYSSPSASWMDVDGDGDDDLYVLNGFGSLEDPPVPQPNRLYINNGMGSFEIAENHPLVAEVTFSGSGVWGDYDNDGDADLFVANQRDADNFLFRNKGGGAFTRITEGPWTGDGGQSFSASWVDIDNDGWLDLHVSNGWANPQGQNDFFYRNLGDGRFEKQETPVVASAVMHTGGPAWADFDGDGDQDVLVPVSSTAFKFRLYRNDGSWNFIEVTEEVGLTHDPLPSSPASSVAEWVDFDNDGDLDLFIGTTGGRIDFLYENDGAGMFSRITAGRLGLDATSVSDATWGDFDNDGDLDLVIAIWGGASELYLNNGSREFHRSKAGDFGSAINFASSVSANDADGDGDLDLYLTHWPINASGGEPNQFYRNDIQSGNWIIINLEGTESNRSGIGSKIIVTASVNGKRIQQTRTVTSRTSWRSSSSLTRHFGLADADVIQEVQVLWPSGISDTLQNVATNRTVIIREGEGMVQPPDVKKDQRID